MPTNSYQRLARTLLAYRNPLLEGTPAQQRDALLTVLAVCQDELVLLPPPAPIKPKRAPKTVAGR